MSFPVRKHLEDSLKTIGSLAAQVSVIEQICARLVSVATAGGTIYSCGNGGSACDAIHLTEELVARFQRERPGIRAQHFCDSGVLTCWSNDYSFDDVFRRQVDTFVSKSDAVVCFSTSGNSINVLKALEATRKKGALAIGFLGKGGGKARECCDIALVVDSDETHRIQEAHMVVIHILCDQLESALFNLP